VNDAADTPTTTVAGARQEEMPFAVIQGEPLTELPRDLYIPPDALEVILEAFEGPLDLLLYLIRRQNLDILDIPIFAITRQYMEYIALMNELRLELAAEYLVMAAMLAEIKSRMLLPKPAAAEEEEDPRAELVRRLQEYERYRQAAEEIDLLPRMEREVHAAQVEAPQLQREVQEPEVDLRELLAVFAEVVRRAELLSHHNVQREPLSVRQRMSEMLSRLRVGRTVEFGSLFSAADGRAGVVVTLLATLELLKEHLIEAVQAEPFAPIYLRATGAAEVPESAVITSDTVIEADGNADGE
jgi:segregation and condensation protein A